MRGRRKGGIGRWAAAGIALAMVAFGPASGAASSPDQYEPDNNPEDANTIVLNSQNPAHIELPGYEWHQYHTFHERGDEDWVMFYSNKYDRIYKVVVNIVDKTACPDCDPMIEIYDQNLTLVKKCDDGIKGDDEYCEWRCNKDGRYYAKLSQYEPGIFGERTQYELMLTIPEAAFSSLVCGKVYFDPDIGACPDVKARVGVSTGFEATANDDGTFCLPLAAANYVLTVYEPHHFSFWKNMIVEEVIIQHVDAHLVALPPGDLNGDDKTDLADAVLTLKTLVEADNGQVRHDYVDSCVDVDDDGRAAMVEALYILRKIAGLN